MTPSADIVVQTQTAGPPAKKGKKVKSETTPLDSLAVQTLTVGSHAND